MNLRLCCFSAWRNQSQKSNIWDSNISSGAYSLSSTWRHFGPFYWVVLGNYITCRQFVLSNGKPNFYGLSWTVRIAYLDLIFLVFRHTKPSEGQTGGQLTLGALDPVNCDSKITYVPLLSDNSWAFNIDGLVLKLC